MERRSRPQRHRTRVSRLLVAPVAGLAVLVVSRVGYPAAPPSGAGGDALARLAQHAARLAGDRVSHPSGAAGPDAFVLRPDVGGHESTYCFYPAPEKVPDHVDPALATQWLHAVGVVSAARRETPAPSPPPEPTLRVRRERHDAPAPAATVVRAELQRSLAIPLNRYLAGTYVAHLEASAPNQLDAVLDWRSAPEEAPLRAARTAIHGDRFLEAAGDVALRVFSAAVARVGDHEWKFADAQVSVSAPSGPSLRLRFQLPSTIFWIEEIRDPRRSEPKATGVAHGSSPGRPLMEVTWRSGEDAANPPVALETLQARLGNALEKGELILFDALPETHLGSLAIVDVIDWSFDRRLFVARYVGAAPLAAPLPPLGFAQVPSFGPDDPWSLDVRGCLVEAARARETR